MSDDQMSDEEERLSYNREKARLARIRWRENGDDLNEEKKFCLYCHEPSTTFKNGHYTGHCRKHEHIPSESQIYVYRNLCEDYREEIFCLHDDLKKFDQQVKDKDEQIKILKEQIEQLENQIKYAPFGQIYQNCKEHFESLLKK